MPIIGRLPGRRKAFWTEGDFEVSSGPPASAGDYLYVVGEIIVPREQADECMEFIEAGSPIESEGAIGGLNSREVPGLGYSVIEGVPGDPGSLPAIVDELIDAGFEATPHHVLVLGNHVEFGPASAPEPVPDTDPEIGLERARRIKDAPGGAPLVVAIDTGILPETHTVISRAAIHPDSDVDYVDQRVVDQGLIPPYLGHGTAVAGVILDRAPGARVLVVRPDGLSLACEPRRATAYPTSSAAGCSVCPGDQLGSPSAAVVARLRELASSTFSGFRL